MFTGYILDPHTAVAKFVADRHNEGDIPLLVAGTAHYAKFGYDVIPAIRQSGRSRCDAKMSNVSELTPIELFREFGSFRALPEMNESLELSMTSPVVHKTVLDANLNIILRELEDFVSK